MNLDLGNRDRRALILAAVVVGGGWSAKLGLPALREWESTQLSVAASALQNRARSVTPLRDSLAARRARLAILDSGIADVATVSEGGAALSSIISDVAESANVRVMSLQIRPDTAVSNGFARVAVRLIGTSDVTGLAALLRDVESETLLAVRELSVLQSEPAAPSSRVESLRIDLLAETLVRVRK